MSFKYVKYIKYSFILCLAQSGLSATCLPTVEAVCQVPTHGSLISNQLAQLNWDERLKKEFRADSALEDGALMFGVNPRGPMGNYWRNYYQTVGKYVKGLTGTPEFLANEALIKSRFEQIRTLFKAVILSASEFESDTKKLMIDYVELTTIESAREYLGQENDEYRAFEVIETCGAGVKNWNASFGPVGLSKRGLILVCPAMILPNRSDAMISEWVLVLAHELGHAIDTNRFETEYSKAWPQVLQASRDPNEMIADIWSQRVMAQYFEKVFVGNSSQAKKTLGAMAFPLCGVPGIQTHESGVERLAKYFLNPKLWGSRRLERLFCQ